MFPSSKFSKGLIDINPAFNDFSQAVFNSSTEPKQIRSSPSSVDHIGIGIPQ